MDPCRWRLAEVGICQSTAKEKTKDTLRLMRNTLLLQHRLLAHHVVVVMAHSLGPDTFESHRDALAHLGSSERFPWSLQAQAPSSRLRLQSPLDGLLLSPLTKEQRKSVKNSKAAEVAGKPYGLTDCLLTIEQLTRDEYPTLSAALGGKLVSRESGYRDITTDSTVTVDDANPTAPFFAIDCEMVRTSEGLELARTSVLDQSGTVLYDQYNIPDRPILDYNTQYVRMWVDDTACRFTLVTNCSF